MMPPRGLSMSAIRNIEVDTTSSETMNSGSRILIRYGNGQRFSGNLLAMVNASTSNVSSATF
jgi:hypothetical protein